MADIAPPSGLGERRAIVASQQVSAVTVEPTVVQLRGVNKIYDVGTAIATEVLHGIDLVVRRGEFCAIVGPSGSGKSTLLNIIGLLDRPTAGTLAVCGEETTHMGDRALTRLKSDPPKGLVLMGDHGDGGHRVTSWGTLSGAPRGAMSEPEPAAAVSTPADGRAK